MQGWGRRVMNRYRVSVCKTKAGAGKVLLIDNGDGCMTLRL